VAAGINYSLTVPPRPFHTTMDPPPFYYPSSSSPSDDMPSLQGQLQRAGAPFEDLGALIGSSPQGTSNASTNALVHQQGGGVPDQSNAVRGWFG
jgi:hypothetical protein